MYRVYTEPRTYTENGTYERGLPRTVLRAMSSLCGLYPSSQPPIKKIGLASSEMLENTIREVVSLSSAY